MNDNILIRTLEGLTMSSREIAELTGKEHRHVLRDIRNMLVKLYGEGAMAKFCHSRIEPQNGQSYPILNLPKRETLILVLGYSVDLRTKIIDRWQALEDATSAKNLSPSELLLMHAQRLVDMEREQAQMKAQVSALVEGENYLTVVGYCNLTGRRIDRVETARLGKLATAVCAANGWETGSANHPVFGRINSYPHEALALVFGD